MELVNIGLSVSAGQEHPHVGSVARLRAAMPIVQKERLLMGCDDRRLCSKTFVKSKF